MKFLYSLIFLLVAIQLCPAPLILPSWSCNWSCSADQCCKPKVGSGYISRNKQCVSYNKPGDACDARPLAGYEGCGCASGLICIQGKCAVKPEGWMPPTTTPKPTTPTTPWPYDPDMVVPCAELKGLEAYSQIKRVLQKFCQP